MIKHNLLPLFIKNCTESCCKDKIINSEFIFGIVSTTIKLPIILNYISFKYDIISFLPTYDLKGNNLIVIYIKEHKENFYQRYFYGGNIFDSKLFYNEKIFKDLYYREIFEKYYKNQGHILKEYWMPKWSNTSDPSARTLEIY